LTTSPDEISWGHGGHVPVACNNSHQPKGWAPAAFDDLKGGVHGYRPGWVLRVDHSDMWASLPGCDARPRGM